MDTKMRAAGKNGDSPEAGTTADPAAKAGAHGDDHGTIELTDVVHEGEEKSAQEEAPPPEPTAEEKLEAKGKELEELRDRLLRVAADFDNHKKRTVKERADLLKFANENLAKNLLEVVDNLERALDHADSSSKEALVEGIVLVQSMFLQALEKFGIKRFSSLGEPFDPAKQEAIQEVHSEDIPEGAVAFELHKGYTIHDRLLRPSRVVLSRGPAPEPQAPAPGEGGEAGATEAAEDRSAEQSDGSDGSDKS